MPLKTIYKFQLENNSSLREKVQPWIPAQQVAGMTIWRVRSLLDTFLISELNLPTQNELAAQCANEAAIEKLAALKLI